MLLTEETGEGIISLCLFLLFYERNRYRGSKIAYTIYQILSCCCWRKLTSLLTTAPRRCLTVERKTVGYQYRVAPGTAMIGNRDNDTPAQSQLAGNEGSSERTSEGLKCP